MGVGVRLFNLCLGCSGSQNYHLEMGMVQCRGVGLIANISTAEGPRTLFALVVSQFIHSSRVPDESGARHVCWPWCPRPVWASEPFQGVLTPLKTGVHPFYHAFRLVRSQTSIKLSTRLVVGACSMFL